MASTPVTEVPARASPAPTERGTPAPQATAASAPQGQASAPALASTLAAQVVPEVSPPTPALQAPISAEAGLEPTFTYISVGWKHACGVRTDGVSICWGNYVRSPQRDYGRHPSTFQAESTGARRG